MFGKKKRGREEESEFVRFRSNENGFDKRDGTEYTQDEIMEVDIKDWWKRHRAEYPNLYRVAMSLLGTQPTSAQPERDFSQAGLFLSTNASTLHPQKVEVRMFCRQNRAYRPNKDTPGTKTEDHSEHAALGVPILKRAAVARYAPSWAPADEA